MENLLDLVDEHTEYFKSHLESLPPQERRVYLALARLWKPSTTREVADLARLNTNTHAAPNSSDSSSAEPSPSKAALLAVRQYYLTERLYNIYYLLRRGTGTDRLVQALINFIICLYSPSRGERHRHREILSRTAIAQIGASFRDFSERISNGTVHCSRRRTPCNG